MFGDLIPHQCLHYIRHQTDLSPTIYRTIQHFNKIICLVITTVLQPSISRRSSWKFSASFDGVNSIEDVSSLSDSTNVDDFSRSYSCADSNPGSYILRGRCISHWIDIAQQCRLLKNFSSLKAIVFGLQSSSINRLTHSWAAVSK